MSFRIQRTAGMLALLFVAGLLALLFVASGCRADVQPDPVPVPLSSPTVTPVPGPLSSPTVAPVAGPVTFHVRLGAGERLTARSPQTDDCPGLDALIDLGPAGTVSLAAYAASCTTRDNAQPGNGRHGVYRTTADIPAERRTGARTVHTALGEATVFNQTYYECTNSCKKYTEPVAVITLEHPSDPAFQALTVYSPKGAIGLERLTDILRDQLLA